MDVTRVLAGIAVTEIEQAGRWYGALFGRPADAEPMDGLAEWYLDGGTVQIVLDEGRAGGSLATLWVPDLREALADLDDLADLAEHGGPSGALDETALFTTLEDPDGNAITLVEVGTDL
jgi:hypothetical protein